MGHAESEGLGVKVNMVRYAVGFHSLSHNCRTWMQFIRGLGNWIVARGPAAAGAIAIDTGGKKWCLAMECE
jgi:hypothetical protein